MVTYIIRRILFAVLVLFGVTLLVFIALRLKGDPVQLLLSQGSPTKQDIEALRHALHLDLPLYQQYFSFIGGALHGDFGDSLRYHTPAFNEVMLRIPATLELSVAAYLFAVVVAVPIGILSAVKRGGFIDFVSRLVSLAGVSLPAFWLGLMFIILFGVRLHWLPVSGRGQDFGGTLKSLILPGITLGLGFCAILTRLLRSSMLDVLQADYIRTARAKGLRNQAVLVRHALRNALLPVVTIAGLQVGALIGGAVIVETVFSWPGVGRLIVDSISNRDYPIVQAGVTLLASVILLSNLAVDLLYVVIDPRIHYE